MSAPFGRQGMALPIVLVGLAGLSVVATAALGDSRSEMALAVAARDSAQAEALADAGIYYGLSMLRHPHPLQRWAADGASHAVAFGAAAIEVAIWDEAGKIDLNGAPVELIGGLIRVVTEDADKADRIADAVGDFRDADALRRTHGAEDADYRSLGMQWPSKDAPFEAVEELLLVAGMSKPLFDRIRPFVTVYTHQRGIDPRFAAREVLAAVPDLQSDIVAALVAARTSDPAGAATLAQASMPGGYSVRSQSRLFSIRSTAKAGQGAAFTRSAVVRMVTTQDRSYAIHYWTSDQG